MAVSHSIPWNHRVPCFRLRLLRSNHMSFTFLNDEPNTALVGYSLPQP